MLYIKMIIALLASAIMYVDAYTVRTLITEQNTQTLITSILFSAAVVTLQ